MTNRADRLVWAGWIVAVAGLAIELFGYQSPTFLGGKTMIVGPVAVLAGLLITVYARRKASA